MKQAFKTWITAAILLLLVNNAFAQSKKKTVPWVSDKGYWVLESNLHTPLKHTVRFYTSENVLMYTEKLEGVKLNADKRKIKMKLKKALELSALTWDKNKGPDADKNYVIAMLR